LQSTVYRKKSAECRIFEKSITNEKREEEEEEEEEEDDDERIHTHIYTYINM
jgi:hypothetical protein